MVAGVTQGSSGAGLPVCWLMAAWFMYGVGGTIVWGAWGMGVCTKLLLDWVDPCGVGCPHGMELLLLEDGGLGESSTKLSNGLKIP